MNVTHAKDFADWMRQRTAEPAIGASDLAVVLGVSPYKSPWRLWAELTGLVPVADSEAMILRMGKDLEPVIAERYAESTGRDVTDWGRFTIIREGNLFATLDRHQCGDTASLELKATGMHAAADWLNEAPLHFQVQKQAQLAVTGYKWGTLACYVWGEDRTRHFDVERNEEFIGLARERVAAFLACVEAKRPPCRPDGSASTTEAIKAITRTVTPGKYVQLPDEATQWDRQLDQLKTEIKKLEHRKAEIENSLRLAIGDATDGILPGGGRYSLSEVNMPAKTTAAFSYRRLNRKK